MRRIRLLAIPIVVLALGYVFWTTGLYHRVFARGGFPATWEPLLVDNIRDFERDPRPIRLRDLTPWEWDEVHSFSGPQMTIDDVSRAVGERIDRSTTVIGDGLPVHVFLDDGEVVRVLSGRDPTQPSNLALDRPLFQTDTRVHDRDAVLVEGDEGAWLVAADEVEEYLAPGESVAP